MSENERKIAQIFSAITKICEKPGKNKWIQQWSLWMNQQKTTSTIVHTMSVAYMIRSHIIFSMCAGIWL